MPLGSETVSVTIGRKVAPQERTVEVTRKGDRVTIVVDSGHQRDGRSELSLYWEELCALPAMIDHVRRVTGEPTAMDH